MKLIRCIALSILAAPLLLAGTPEIIGHRGVPGGAPENTIPAFKLALEERADGFELDIRLTKDGRAAVMHDPSAKRTSGVDLVVPEHTFEELRKLDVGSSMDAKWKGEPIPSLEESLAVLPTDKKIYIEIKCGPEILPELRRVLDAAGKRNEQLVIIAFNYETLAKAKELFPGIKTLWLVGAKKDKNTDRKTYPDLGELADKALKAGFSGLDLNEGFPLDAAAVAGIKAKGLMVAVWTVDGADQARKFAAAGVDAITTNKPRTIRQALEGK